MFCKMAFFSSKCSPRMAKTSSRSSSIVRMCNKMHVAGWQRPKWTQCARCKYPSFYDLTAIKTLNLYKPSSDWLPRQLPWWSPGVHQVSPPVPRLAAPEVFSRKPECGACCETPGSGPLSQLPPVESDPQGVKWLPDYTSHKSGSVLPFSPHVPPTSGRRAAALRKSRENRDMSFLPSRPNPHRAHKTRDSQPEQGQQGPVSGPLRLRPVSTESGRAMPCLWCSD